MRGTGLAVLALVSCNNGKLIDLSEYPSDTSAAGLPRDTGTVGEESGVPEDTAGPVDEDGDGFPVDEDCDDTDGSVHPGADEVCDGIDNDCDEAVDVDDDDLVDGTTYLPDLDGDGYGDAAGAVLSCEFMLGMVVDEGGPTDCDDTDPTSHPGAEERCDDPVDRNCDGFVGYEDHDGDGWAACEECDDTDPMIHPDASEVCNLLDDDCDGLIDAADDSLDPATMETFYEDLDGDGFGSEDRQVVACDAPEGHVPEDPAGFDCNDFDTRYHPGADEYCDDPEDYNCDGSVSYEDADGDGWPACEECDDRDSAVHPDAAEICNGLDDDCDGLVDDADPEVDLETGRDWYLDADGDGFGREDGEVRRCEAEEGWVGDDSDCDDEDPSVHTEADEICNNKDDNCNDLIDDADPEVRLETGSEFHRDADGDGYGDPDLTEQACDVPAGHVWDDTDCDDAAWAVNPGATEICNGIDDDCDALIDDEDEDVDLSTGTLWYLDVDGDGYGLVDVVVLQCDSPADHVTDATDCDDSEAAVHPGATEVCNTVDDDCDGLIDDDDPDRDARVGGREVYADTDGDGYGGAGGAFLSCLVPAGATATADDCDDTDPAISPSASEVCNDLDDDCDGLVDDEDDSLDLGSATEWYADSDRDGWGAGSSYLVCVLDGGVLTDGDCDDGDAALHPGAEEVCDGVDNDCDGSTDEGFDPITYSTYESGSSCAGRGNWYAQVSACGCTTVTLNGSFSDHSDGSGGQVVGLSLGSSSASTTWDDCSSGCDCDLDISTSTGWSGSRSGDTLTVSVSNSITGYDAGNSISAGFSISSYGTYHGNGSWSFSYSCGG